MPAAVPLTACEFSTATSIRLADGIDGPGAAPSPRWSPLPDIFALMPPIVDESRRDPVGLPGIASAWHRQGGQHDTRGPRTRECAPATRRRGVGIGGTKDQAFGIAKQAAQLRPIGDRHPDPVVAALEDELLEMANSLGIGAMGYPGTAGYATDVHVEIAYTHSALTPLGIHQLCQASRRGIVRVHMDGRVETRSEPSWFSPYSRRLGVE